METTRVCSWKKAGDEIHIYIYSTNSIPRTRARKPERKYGTREIIGKPKIDTKYYEELKKDAAGNTTTLL